MVIPMALTWWKPVTSWNGGRNPRSEAGIHHMDEGRSPLSALYPRDPEDCRGIRLREPRAAVRVSRRIGPTHRLTAGRSAQAAHESHAATLHRQFSWNVRFLSLGFPVLDCRLILDHSDMPVGAQYSFETLTRKYVARQTFSHPRYYRTSDPGPDEYLDAPR